MQENTQTTTSTFSTTAADDQDMTSCASTPISCAQKPPPSPTPPKKRPPPVEDIFQEDNEDDDDDDEPPSTSSRYPARPLTKRQRLWMETIQPPKDDAVPSTSSDPFAQGLPAGPPPAKRQRRSAATAAAPLPMMPDLDGGSADDNASVSKQLLCHSFLFHVHVMFPLKHIITLSFFLPTSKQLPTTTTTTTTNRSTYQLMQLL